jgi:hypothetical protein
MSIDQLIRQIYYATTFTTTHYTGQHRIVCTTKQSWAQILLNFPITLKTPIIIGKSLGKLIYFF